MSHFTVLVIGDDVEESLAPFDENIELAKYVEYTREQLIAKSRQKTEDYKNGRYAKYLADPVKYKAECSNEDHINYLKNEFPKKLQWTDQEHYEDAIRYYEPEDIGADGEVYSTRNPQGYWDWYQIGGRWNDSIILKPNIEWTQPEFPYGRSEEAIKNGTTDTALIKEIDFDAMKLKNQSDDWAKDKHPLYAYAYVQHGRWHGRGTMGWFGMSDDKVSDEDWNKEISDLIDSLDPETRITFVDCHI